MAKIYLSSTYEDLKEFREALYKSLRKLRHDVVAMEDYVAADCRPLDKCLADVRACEVYIGIFAWRYGYVPTHDNPDKKSITELEYRTAKEKKRLIFLLDRKARWTPNYMDSHTGENDRGQSIAALRQELGQERTVSMFETPEGLASLATAAVTNMLQDQQGAPLVLPSEVPAMAVRPSQYRELTHDLFVAYSDLDKALVDDWVGRLRDPFGRKVLASFKAFFAETDSDLRELEGTARRCHASAVVLSERSLQQVQQAAPRLDLVLEVLGACSGPPLGVWCGPAPGHFPAAWRLGSAVIPLVDDRRPPGKPAAAAAVAADQEIESRRQAGGALVVGLPFVTLAMTDREAHELASQPERLKTKFGDEPLELFRKLREVVDKPRAHSWLERYGPTREAWRPFGTALPPARAVVEDIVKGLNDRERHQLRERRIRVQHYPFDPLVRNDLVLRPIYRELAQTGCILLLDELSLFHWSLRDALLKSPFINNPQVAWVTISPFNLGHLLPVPVAERELYDQLAHAFERFAADYDPQCEFGVGDELRLRRWLYSSLPQALRNLRQPPPDRRALQGFAAEVGRDRRAGMTEVLYAPQEGA